MLFRNDLKQDTHTHTHTFTFSITRQNDSSTKYRDEEQLIATTNKQNILCSPSVDWKAVPFSVQAS